jgi:beta-fructofuranosidase
MMADLLWSPAEHQVGDPTIIRVGEEYHLFAEMGRLDATPGAGGMRIVGHAVSRDLFGWEELPVALHCGVPGSFDADNIYHMDVLIHDGTWYMFYTGLDIAGPGQQQAIGLATSRDGIVWEKHPGNPILRADPRWYEPAIPREATYQEKDFGRLWFRDAVVVRDDATGRWVMLVVARDAARHPDVRGCLALATSDDLLHWTLHPPVFSTGRFHTIETPSVFERSGSWYLIYMTHPGWGPPILSTDPHQEAGDFYAISDNGPAGPFQAPEDEVLIASCGARQRMGACRTVDMPDGERLLYGWLLMQPRDGDGPVHRRDLKVIPPPRRMLFTPDGQMRAGYYEAIERFCEPVEADLTQAQGEGWRQEAGGPVGKDYSGRSVALLPGTEESAIASIRVRFERGDRAGLVLRAGEDGSGWQVTADRRFGRVEFGLLDREGWLDARAWAPADEVTLTVIAYRESVEVYADGRLMLHQVRHREIAGRLGVFVERAEARFDRLRVMRFTER